MRVLFVTSECVPLFKLGGLADVSYALPVALHKLGVQVAVALPYYEKIKAVHVRCVGQLAVDYDRRRELVFIFQTEIQGTNVTAYLFRHPLLNTYGGHDIVDTFAFFSKAVTQLFLYSPGVLGKPYDIIHCNDWHTALIPLLLGEKNRYSRVSRETIQSQHVKTVLTIHNMLYQGETGIAVTLRLGLPKEIFHIFTTPLGRAVKLLREGLDYADVITTVSPTYAKELTRGHHGDQIKAVLSRRRDRLVGILNGIDSGVWNPETDRFLPRTYTAKSAIAAKKEIKTYLQRSLKLPERDVLLFGFVGRLEEKQKGIDLIARAIEELEDTPFQLALLGTGAARQVALLEHLVKRYPQVAFAHTFDDRLARRIYAGADVMLVPSKFEPCGLTQMIAMRYGTLPLVRKTGGLADTVADGETGFVFGPYRAAALTETMREAISLWNTKPEAWRHMISRAMGRDFSWEASAREYRGLYRKLLKT